MRYFATKLRQIKPLRSAGRAIYTIITGILLIIVCSPVAIHLEQSTGLHLFFSMRGPIPPPKDIAIIALNSSASQKLKLSSYSGNWPRTLHAKLINKLHKAGARLIVMDIMFKSEHSETEDASLQQALASSKSVILFTYLKRHQISTGQGVIDIETEIPPISRFEESALGSASFTLPKYPAQVFSTRISAELSSGLEATQPLLAYLELQKPEDLEAIWRSIKSNNKLSQTPKTRARQLLTEAHKIPPSLLSKQQKTISTILKHSQPLTINFYGYPQTLTTWPFDQALNMTPEQMTQAFGDKTVYIGFSENIQTEQQDAYRTVFSSDLGVDISGVEISATVFTNLKDGNYITAASPLQFFLITLGALFFGFTCYRLPIYWAAAIQAFAVGSYVLMGYILFSTYNHWLPLATPCIALFISNSFMLSKRFNSHKKRIQHIQFALSQYLPNDAAKKLSRNVTALEKQHQLVHGVCLMTDIQGYTRLSESLAPDKLHALMNVYYTELIETVEEHGGFIANLVGDGMLALWTGPEITPSMCQAALHASQQIQQRTSNNIKLEHPLPTCSAIHGGQFSLGNLGALGHFEYSPVGDIINTVSRVEHFNRNLGTQFLCTKPIAEQLASIKDNSIQLQHLGSFTFRHKSVPMPLYGLANNISKAQSSLYQQALTAYEQRDYDTAETKFKILVRDFKDQPSKHFLLEINNA